MHFHQNVFCKMEFLQLLFVITWTHVYTYKYQRIDTQIPIMYNSYSLYFQPYLYTCTSYSSLLSSLSDGRLTPHTHTHTQYYVASAVSILPGGTEHRIYK